MKNSDLYRLFYRSLKLSEKEGIEPYGKIELPEKNIETNVRAPVSTKELVQETLNELQFIKTSIGHEERLGDFDINNLPLIGVSKYLNILVFKSLSGYTCYKPEYRAIYIGSDRSKHIFLHEFAHAVDHILPKQKYRTSYKELVAELTAVILCKIYSVPFSISYAKWALNWECGSQPNNINNANMINRVVEIVDYIRQCKRAIDSAADQDN